MSKLVDLGFARLDGPGLLQASPGHPAAPLIGFLGAGLYEEALFRLTLMPTFFYGLRLLQTPILAANTLAVTGSALLFSLAHHAGSPGEAFTWYAFIFRWLAGVFFAWVFAARGFGVAVGTHSAYDILVGWLDLATSLTPAAPGRSSRADHPAVRHPRLALCAATRSA